MKKTSINLTSEAIADGAKSGLTKADMLKLGMYSIDAKVMYAKFGISAYGYVIPYGNEFERAKILKYTSKFGEVPKQKYTQKSGTGNRLYLQRLVVLIGKKYHKIQRNYC